jgi:hypothetical protein
MHVLIEKKKCLFCFCFKIHIHHQIEALAGHLARNKTERRASVLSVDVGDVDHHNKIDPSDFLTLFFVMRSKKTVSQGQLPMCDFRLNVVTTQPNNKHSPPPSTAPAGAMRSSKSLSYASRGNSRSNRLRGSGGSIVSSIDSF